MFCPSIYPRSRIPCRNSARIFRAYVANKPAPMVASAAAVRGAESGHRLPRHPQGWPRIFRLGVACQLTLRLWGSFMPWGMNYHLHRAPGIRPMGTSAMPFRMIAGFDEHIIFRPPQRNFPSYPSAILGGPPPSPPPLLLVPPSSPPIRTLASKRNRPAYRRLQAGLRFDIANLSPERFRDFWTD